VSYTNPQTGHTIKAEQVQATASVRLVRGPFAIDGTATVNGVPCRSDVSVTRRATMARTTPSWS
jgi:hypothetical protein